MAFEVQFEINRHCIVSHAAVHMKDILNHFVQMVHAVLGVLWKFSALGEE